MAIYMWREYEPPELCFTANTAGSTVALNKTWSPTAVTLETSTDGNNRNTYTIWNTITLSNIWDKVYFRNTSTTTTGFSVSDSNYYKFVMTGSISASGDVNYLLCKNSTTTIIGNCCFNLLFNGCRSLTSAPELPATTLTRRCYYRMFYMSWITIAPRLPATTLADECYCGMFMTCQYLASLPQLNATTLPSLCYMQMFSWCSNIKLSTTQTWEYQTPYRIPTTWTGSNSVGLSSMFSNTWWTFSWTPSINTTYYTSNTVV